MSLDRRRLEHAVACFSNPSQRAAFLDLFAPEAVLYGWGAVRAGRAAVADFYESLWMILPDAHLRIEDVREHGEFLAARFILTGATATGREVVQTGLTWFRFAAGRCVESWCATDRRIQTGAGSVSYSI